MPSKKTVLFLCTGNYYRSRFAECLFNSVAAKFGLPWQADSRGLALERRNVGPMAPSAIEALHAHGIRSAACERFPAALTLDELTAAQWVVALQEAEHRPLLAERFPEWADRVEYWHVADALDIFGDIEREVSDLVARLLAGGRKRAAGPLPALVPEPAVPAQPKTKQVARVGRETKGRRGKGVTIVWDLALDEAALRELAATLKQRCGTGGTVKDGRIEIQGDLRDRVAAELERLGYGVKKAGG